MNYYCSMTEQLTTSLSNQILLEDKCLFSYTVNPYELTNGLGKIVAILQEYIFTKEGEINESASYKLYKTKEGNRYEITEAISSTEYNILRSLKMTIEKHENVLVNQSFFEK